jgi:hypothetical protein
MDDPDVIFADPWLKKSEKTTSLPNDAYFACSYEMNYVVERFDEAAFFRRTETTDELWIGEGGIANGTDSAKNFEGAKLSDIGCVFVVPREGEEVTACLKLMELFFRARHGFVWPSKFVVPGIVDKPAFDSLVGRIENELKENAQKARESETEIIKVARELGLSPEPTGHGPSHWCARCPGTNHVLFIDSAENSFGCGWCKRKGTAQELRAFVKERKNRRTSL